MRMHNGYRPFQCALCPVSYTIKGSLKRHMLSHYSDISFKCHICKKEYSRQCTLKKHLQTHRNNGVTVSSGSGESECEKKPLGEKCDNLDSEDHIAPGEESVVYIEEDSEKSMKTLGYGSDEEEVCSTSHINENLDPLRDEDKNVAIVCKEERQDMIEEMASTSGEDDGSHLSVAKMEVKMEVYCEEALE